jgi:hypothetical protein
MNKNMDMGMHTDKDIDTDVKMDKTWTQTPGMDVYTRHRCDPRSPIHIHFSPILSKV